MRSANAENRKLKIEKIAIQQELDKVIGDAEVNNIEEVFTRLLNTECVDGSVKDETDDVPIKRFSQNIDFSRLERKRSRSQGGIIKNKLDEENKENLDNSVKSESQVVENTASCDVTAALMHRKVMFSENSTLEMKEEKPPIRKGVKVYKSNPIVIHNRKK